MEQHILAERCNSEAHDLQACGREQDCIQVYKTVEQTHPVNAIKKQAAELRFIMEAPKLQLRPEERISLPLLDNLDRYKYVTVLDALYADVHGVKCHLYDLCVC